MADAYILSHVIHDWDEDQCLTILGNVRKAMNSASRLLLVEMVLPFGDTPHPGKMLDMTMLVSMGGQERTEVEYGALLSEAGFQLTRVVSTSSAASIVEAVVISDLRAVQTDVRFCCDQTKPRHEAGALCCVPSMTDSLEVKVLYPA
jgi:hypothetical protein